MPKRIAEDHKEFRDVVSGRTRKALKDAIVAGKISFSGQPIQITIPQVALPNFTWNGTEYSSSQEEIVKKKPKLHRSIEEPWEPAW